MEMCLIRVLKYGDVVAQGAQIWRCFGSGCSDMEMCLIRVLKYGDVVAQGAQIWRCFGSGFSYRYTGTVMYRLKCGGAACS